MGIVDIEISAEYLLEFWKKQGIVSPPNTLDDILYFESSKCVQLPDDFRRLFMMVNGMVDLYPNYCDEEGFLFYPLQKLITLEEEFNIEQVNSVEQCFVFAEFMHKSWWYGVKFSKFTDAYEIGIIPSVGKFKVITQNLGNFIHLYTKNAPILYEY